MMTTALVVCRPTQGQGIVDRVSQSPAMSHVLENRRVRIEIMSSLDVCGGPTFTRLVSLSPVATVGLRSCVSWSRVGPCGANLRAQAVSRKGHTV